MLEQECYRKSKFRKRRLHDRINNTRSCGSQNQKSVLFCRSAACTSSPSSLSILPLPHLFATPDPSSQQVCTGRTFPSSSHSFITFPVLVNLCLLIHRHARPSHSRGLLLGRGFRPRPICRWCSRRRSGSMPDRRRLYRHPTFRSQLCSKVRCVMSPPPALEAVS